MARPVEFTDLRIRSKIEDMAAAGTVLSAFAVRRALGGGNMNRIAGVLAEWEATKTPQPVAPEMIELPVELQAEVDSRMAELSSGLSSTIARIHRRATEIAEGRVTDAVKAARAAATSAEAELADARAILTETDEQIEQLTAEVDRLRHAEQALQQQHADHRAAIGTLSERAEAAERHVQELTTRGETMAAAADAAKERAAAATARAEEATAERQRGEERERRLTDELAGLRRLLEEHFSKPKK